MAVVTEIVLSGETASEEEAREARRGVRCAIYTRASGDAGLDRDCNSLDVQREACEAFVASRRGEGWTLAPERYDDGGYSGAGAERPALQRLLSDVEEGKLDCVVVYKLDRLSRSIVDFARIVEALDSHGVGFVSITQQFDTTRPLRGLLVNVLLSFAQFERELMAERAARGKWRALLRGARLGGQLMLGYTVHPHGRRLIAHDEEAEEVRAIFALYLERRSVRAVVEELNRRGWRTKHQVTKKGRELGGRPFDPQSVYRVLKYPLYIGKARVGGELHSSGHEPLVDEEVWRRAQELLEQNATAGGKRAQNRHGAVLKGLLHCDACGAPMRHYTSGRGSGWRYYACVDGRCRIKRTCPTGSVPAAELERRVVERIRGLGAPSHPAAGAVRRAMERCEARIGELEERRQAVLEELKRLDAGLCALLAAIASPGDKSAPQLAVLDAGIPAAQERMRAIRRGLVSSHRELVDARSVRRAMAAFSAGWDALVPSVRWESLKLLVARVGYNSRACEAVVRFRPEVLPGVPDTRIGLGVSGDGTGQ